MILKFFIFQDIDPNKQILNKSCISLQCTIQPETELNRKFVFEINRHHKNATKYENNTNNSKLYIQVVQTFALKLITAILGILQYSVSTALFNWAFAKTSAYLHRKLVTSVKSLLLMMTMIRVSVSSAGAISFKLNNLRYDGHKGLNLTLDKKTDSCNFSCIVILSHSRACMAILC